MKKGLLLLLVTTMTFSMYGCGNAQGNVHSNNSSQLEESAQKKEEETVKQPEIKIKDSPDKYTWYIPDFVGRNLANCGYISLSGDLMHRFGPGYAKCVIIPEDGSYIDPEDKETLKKYVVTSQNIAPNTELNLTLQKDSDGNEYDNLVEYQNIAEIELNVKPIHDEQ